MDEREKQAARRATFTGFGVGGEKIKRTLKEIPDTVLRANSPHDFLDFSLSYYLPETKERIEKVIDEFHARIGEILDEDREKAGITE